MRELILELPDQLRWAAQLDSPAVPEADEMLVAAMGGSAIGAAVAAVVAETSGRRIGVHRSYGLPGWSERHRPLVAAVSHSGNTEETLDAVAVADAAGLPIVAATTGGRLAELARSGGWPLISVPSGPQPRAAMGYLTGAILRLAEAAGLVPPQGEALHEAADVVERILGGGDGPGFDLAADLAAALDGRVAVICGGEGVGAVAAGRWKTQINENGKAPAYAAVLPELDHNEVVGWEAFPRLSENRFGLVWLHDAAEHPRVEARARITAELLDGRVGMAGDVYSVGAGVLARVFSLTVIGDLVSDAIAARAGFDPMPVDVIEDLKKRLADE
jgi:glucose/mannose-6-phosphate isomerase